MIITLICGGIAAKILWFNNNLIPIQNITIGLISALIYYIFTKDISFAIATAGIFSGGVYDIANNLNKLFMNKSKEDK